MKDLEVKTHLSDAHHAAMLRVIDAKGLTQAGYVRHLILRDIVNSEDLVCQVNEISERAKAAKIQRLRGKD